MKRSHEFPSKIEMNDLSLRQDKSGNYSHRIPMTVDQIFMNAYFLSNNIHECIVDYHANYVRNALITYIYYIIIIYLSALLTTRRDMTCTVLKAT